MIESVNQPVVFEGISFTVKREDILHPEISGNKYRKLKYNLVEAKKKGYQTLLTFGGAFSNHIAATAAAGKEYGFNTVGIIRGEEIEDKLDTNPTLQYAGTCGMQFHFVTREAYRKKETPEFMAQLKEQFGDFYAIPEGGTNELAIKGCEEIVVEDDARYDIICTSVGTGGTIAGLINSTKVHQKVLGFSSLKGDFLKDEILKYTDKKNWELITDYHFGGYGKIKPELITFINQFRVQTGVLLDPIYTGKMCYGMLQMIREKRLDATKNILVIHTGGLQGIEGINNKLRRQQMPLIVN